MEEKSSDLRKKRFQKVKWPIICLVLFVLFYQKVISLADGILVTPLLATIEVTPAVLIIFVSLPIVIVIHLINIALKGVHLSLAQVAWIGFAVLLYTIVRFLESDRYEYMPVNTYVKLADVLYVYPVSLVIYYIIMYKRKSKINVVSSVYNGFYIDQPISINETNDIYHRCSQLPILAGQILATKNTDKSFGIGIIGKWGAGKTSFLYGLRDEFKKHSDIIDLEFNPWMVGSPEKIVASFFQDLIAKLSEFDKELKDELVTYANNLIKTYDDSNLKPIQAFLNILDSDTELVEKYNKVNDSIRLLGKKIVIRIDDVDRLEEKEVIEVLRIVRNTANFGNTFFW